MDINPTLQAIFSRRSIRRFAERPLPAGQVELLLAAGMAAPSAHGRAPRRFALVEDPVVVARITHDFPWFSAAATAACNILVIGEPSLSVAPEYWPQDCAAATENILVAATSLGLGSCWMGLAPLEDNIARWLAIVPLPPGLVPFCLIAVGYPGAGEAFLDPVPRLDRSRILSLGPRAQPLH